MLDGSAKRTFNSGPGGPAGATTAAALTDVVAAIKAVLQQPDLPSARIALGLAIGTNVQGWDSDLDAIAAQGTAAFGRSLLAGGDAATVRTLLVLGSAAVLAAGLPGGAATLDGSTGKLLAAQIPDALLGALRYQGGWNASTNTPALPTPATANKGFYYIVTVAGSTSQPGPSGAITDWQLGDWAVSDGTYWEKVDSSDQVISVAGLQGAITATALKVALAIASTDITDATTLGKALLTAASAAAALSSLGAVAASAPGGTVKANLLGSTANVTDATFTQLLDAIYGAGAARGAILVRGASTWGGLALGASGNTLQSNGTDLVFAAASPGAGAVRNDTAQNPSAAAIAYALANVGALFEPQGRLTLTSGVPVLGPATQVSGAALIVYTPYRGDLALVGAGLTTSPVPVVFAEVSQALSDATKSPAAAAAASVYDLFAWMDGSTFRVTRGPAWSAGASAGSNTARGAGAGSTELVRVSGVLVNKNAITNGPAAGYGVHVGTIMTDASGATVSMTFGGSASGGSAAVLGVWNAYNRRRVRTESIDTSSSWSYGGSARMANNSASQRVTFVQGVSEEPIEAKYTCLITVGGNSGYISLGLDAAPTMVGAYGFAQNGTTGEPTAFAELSALGAHYLQAYEQTGGIAATFIGGAGNNRLAAGLMM